MGSAPWNRSGERWQAGHGGGRCDAGASGEHCAGKKSGTAVKPPLYEAVFFAKIRRRADIIVLKEGMGMKLREFLHEQFAVIKEKDPAIRSPLEVWLYPSFRVQLSHRRAHRLYQKGHYFRARWISQRAKHKTGIEIHPGATIGRRLFIDHGAGVVIGETAEIGDDVTIYQGVTLGGTGKEKGKRHPTIGDGVLISTDAQILGSFRVGSHSRIGAGSVVLSEVPDDCTVVGIPGDIVKRGNKRVDPAKMLDQVSLPDPVEMEICRLRNQLAKLEQQLQEKGLFEGDPLPVEDCGHAKMKERKKEEA